MSNEGQSSTAADAAINVQIEALYADLHELEQLVAMLKEVCGPPGPSFTSKGNI